MRIFAINEVMYGALQCAQLPDRATVTVLDQVAGYAFGRGVDLAALPKNIRPITALLCHAIDLQCGSGSEELLAMLKQCPHREPKQNKVPAADSGQDATAAVSTEPEAVTAGAGTDPLVPISAADTAGMLAPVDAADVPRAVSPIPVSVPDTAEDTSAAANSAPDLPAAACEHEPAAEDGSAGDGEQTRAEAGAAPTDSADADSQREDTAAAGEIPGALPGRHGPALSQKPAAPTADRPAAASLPHRTVSQPSARSTVQADCKTLPAGSFSDSSRQAPEGSAVTAESEASAEDGPDGHREIRSRGPPAVQAAGWYLGRRAPVSRNTPICLRVERTI